MRGLHRALGPAVRAEGSQFQHRQVGKQPGRKYRLIDLNIYAFVGLIMLIGIVEKNAIMQIDFALEAERQHGLAPRDAIYEGCLIRFRPIMMTTMSAMLGAVPIALGYGAGGEARQPLGLVVVGGLLFSQLVTLYLTPVFYTYMAALQERVQRRKRSKLELEAPAAG